MPMPYAWPRVVRASEARCERKLVDTKRLQFTAHVATFADDPTFADD